MRPGLRMERRKQPKKHEHLGRQLFNEGRVVHSGAGTRQQKCGGHKAGGEQLILRLRVASLSFLKASILIQLPKELFVGTC